MHVHPEYSLDTTDYDFAILTLCNPIHFTTVSNFFHINQYMTNVNIYSQCHKKFSDLKYSELTEQRISTFMVLLLFFLYWQICI